MPTVQRHEDVESWFFGVARKHLTRGPRRGIHVSDLLTPRKAYWARVQPKPPTNREVIFFLAGRGHEEVFVALAGLSGYHKSRGEWLGPPDSPYKAGDGIRYEIDVLTRQDGTGQEIPIEIKTNRRPTIPGPEKVLEEYSIAVDQLGMYTAVRNESNPDILTSYLIEIHLMARNLALKEGAKGGEEPDEQATGQEADPYAWLRESKPEMVVYQIDWTAEELEAIRKKMADTRGLLELSLERKDHRVLPACPKWMCGKEHIRESDPYCPTCGRVYENRRMRKCEDCKDGKARVDLKRNTETLFVPTCRWWPECRPTENWPQYIDNYFRPRAGDVDG